MKYRVSELDGETLVIEIEPGDSGPIVSALETRGHGYAVYGEDVPVPFVVVDGRLIEQTGYTHDHLFAIEAHELGHIHEASNDEPTAERAGIKILLNNGLDGAADLLKHRGVI